MNHDIPEEQNQSLCLPTFCTSRISCVAKTYGLPTLRIFIDDY